MHSTRRKYLLLWRGWGLGAGPGDGRETGQEWTPPQRQRATDQTKQSILPSPSPVWPGLSDPPSIATPAEMVVAVPAKPWASGDRQPQLGPATTSRAQLHPPICTPSDLRLPCLSLSQRTQLITSAWGRGQPWVSVAATVWWRRFWTGS